ncbi:hypothetical protein ACTU45_27285, partial [Streptomyces sp. 24-1644]
MLRTPGKHLSRRPAAVLFAVSAALLAVAAACAGAHASGRPAPDGDRSWPLAFGHAEDHAQSVRERGGGATEDEL